jgi:hypothetical protein
MHEELFMRNADRLAELLARERKPITPPDRG